FGFAGGDGGFDHFGGDNGFGYAGGDGGFGQFGGDNGSGYADGVGSLFKIKQKID
ncbi:unnamed protein product, partial [Didymodactylos carnosus]